MAEALNKLLKNMKKRFNEALKESAELLEDTIRDNAGLTDHKLDALEKLGHPYAVRDPRRIHTPDFQVHKQSGRLADNIEVKKIEGDKTTIFVGVDDTEVPYIRHVIRGTRFMVGRDFITGSFNQVNNKITRIFAKKLKQGEDASTDKTKAD